jgi:uracil-DNA glycosylase family 4
MTQEQRQPTQVFISYSHRDRAALARLQVHLKPLEREGLVERWDDTRIQPGGLWKDEIQNALASARVAVLLVSADFLASDFIAAEELPPLLEAERARGLVILPVILGPCRYEKTTLARFQAVNDPARPLYKMRKPEREAVWVKLANDIEEALERPVRHPPESRPNPAATVAVVEPAVRTEAAQAEVLTAGPTRLFDEPQLDGPPLLATKRPAALARLAAEVAACTKCPLLASTRTRTVFGEGSLTPRLMFVGEAPGIDEDRTGRPFVGRSGMLLTEMVTKGMGLAREEVYVANVLKSRTPENRIPLPDEVAHCLPFLERQIAILRPEFLCLLGKVAVSALLETALPIGGLRGRWHRCRGIPTVVTWHPAYLHRYPAAKKETWADLQMLMKAMGLKPPGRKTT